MTRPVGRLVGFFSLDPDDPGFKPLDQAETDHQRAHGSRWWIFPTTAEDNPEFPAGWWAVVDDQAGGIIAAAATEDGAELIRVMFDQRGRRSTARPAEHEK